MAPTWVRVSRGYRRRQLSRYQRITSVEVENSDVLRAAVTAGQGVLITPNHSAHYDAPALYIAADSIDQPLYFMTAWQVFAMSNRWEQWAMQRLGCFSVDREATDRQAIKQAVHVLQNEPHPLVIFPEGDIYHTADHVTHFRDGAAAIALTAVKRSSRPVIAVPCAIKFWYVDNPSGELHAAMEALEQRLYLRTDETKPLVDRIHRMAEAALALKELDYLGHTCSGRLRDRITHLAEHVLSGIESRHAISRKAKTIPERVKVLRSKLIGEIEELQPNPSQNGEIEAMSRGMEDLFFVMQLYSYRGDYLIDNPSIERLAETIDKFEEDILGLEYPRVRGRRKVVIRFGEPVPVERAGRQDETAELTGLLESRVQALLDELNARSPTAGLSDTMP
jgi:1-acyl-sn-glycerol-3-phosphate acyltransferase